MDLNSWTIEKNHEYNSCSEMWTKRLGPKGGPLFSLMKYEYHSHNYPDSYELELCSRLKDDHWMKISVYSFSDLEQIDEYVERLTKIWDMYKGLEHEHS